MDYVGSVLRRVAAGLERYVRDERASSTVEAVLWIPILFWLLILITDVSFIFYGRAEAMRIVQDGNRAYSVGRLTDEQETEDFILQALSHLAPHATAETLLDKGIISTDVEIPATDLTAIGAIPGLSGFNIAVRSQHFLES